MRILNSLKLPLYHILSFHFSPHYSIRFASFISGGLRSSYHHRNTYGFSYSFSTTSFFYIKKLDSSSASRSHYYNNNLVIIRNLLENNPINNELQRKIENLSYDSVIDYLSNKNKASIGDINIDNFVNIHNDLSKEIYSSYNKLIALLFNIESKMDLLINKKDDLRRSKQANKVFKDRASLIKEIFITLKVEHVASLILSFWYRFIAVYDINDSDEDNITKTLSLQTFNTNLAKYIIKNYEKNKYDIYCSLLKSQNKKKITMSTWYNNRSDLELTYLKDDEFIILLGTKLSELICRLPLDFSGDNLGLLESKLVKTHDKQIYIVVIPDYIRDIMNKGNKPLIVLPYKLPMIVKPKHYDSTNNGGYLTNDELEVTNLIKNKPHYKYNSVINDNNEIYNMVNHLSNVGYKINKVLLEFLIEKGTDLGIVSNMPILSTTDNNKKSKVYNYEVTKYKSQYSKWLLEQNIIELADVYKNNVIYFPVSLDQRGRLYCTPSYLNYQSTDLSKALLLFSKPGIITRDSKRSRVESLFIYGANTYGLDKLSHTKRLNWVNENKDNIIN